MHYSCYSLFFFGPPFSPDELIEKRQHSRQDAVPMDGSRGLDLACNNAIMFVPPRASRTFACPTLIRFYCLFRQEATSRHGVACTCLLDLRTSRHPSRAIASLAWSVETSNENAQLSSQQAFIQTDPPVSYNDDDGRSAPTCLHCYLEPDLPLCPLTSGSHAELVIGVSISDS